MALKRRGYRRPLSTVRGRTAVAACLVVAAALAVGGVTLHTLLRSTLVQNIDSVAELRAEDLAGLAASGNLPDPVGVEDDALVQIVDGSGRVVAASENVRGRPPLARLRPPPDDALAITIDGPPPLAGQFRLIALTAKSPTEPLTVYVGSTLEPVEDTMRVLRTSLAVGSPLLVALVGLLTWMTVGRALRPVEAIRSQVAEISTRDLGRRVPAPDVDDEIGRLAETMNAMLGRLESSVERQRRFVADASHELQSPLAAARTNLEVALAHPEAALWGDVAHDLLEENRRMERLVADLLFVARADGSALPKRPSEPIDLHEVVLEEAARVFASSRLSVDTSAVEAAVVNGRRDDLARAVRNLLDNASHYGSSAVTIELTAADHLITLVVADDGPGVAPEDRERIFERFARLDDARSHGETSGGTSGGTGLGLAIVSEIVRAHAGQVAAHGGATGARFVVTLPAG